MFFDDTHDLVCVLVAGTIAYLWLIAVLRVTRQADPRTVERRRLPEVLHAQRMTRDSLQAVVRRGGVGGLGRVAAIMLETNRRVGAISRKQTGSGSTLAGLG